VPVVADGWQRTLQLTSCQQAERECRQGWAPEVETEVHFMQMVEDLQRRRGAGGHHVRHQRGPPLSGQPSTGSCVSQLGALRMCSMAVNKSSEAPTMRGQAVLLGSRAWCTITHLPGDVPDGALCHVCKEGTPQFCVTRQEQAHIRREAGSETDYVGSHRRTSLACRSGHRALKEEEDPLSSAGVPLHAEAPALATP